MDTEKDPGESGGIDSYEKEYMRGDGKVLRREKTLWRLHWIMLLPIFSSLIVAVLGALKPGDDAFLALIPLVIAGFLSVVWLLFRTLRVHVTEEAVHIQYGIFGPRIPVDAITSCRVVNYRRLESLGLPAEVYHATKIGSGPIASRKLLRS